MTVRELKKRLEGMPDRAIVAFDHDRLIELAGETLLRPAERDDLDRLLERPEGRLRVVVLR